MKIKKDYVLKKIGYELIIVPINNEAIRFNGIITVNKTGAFLFNILQESDISFEELIEKVMDHYDVDEGRARNDALAFIKICKDHSLLDEE